MSEQQSIPARLIFWALVVGAAVGVVANSYAGGSPTLGWVIRNVTEPIGQVWLRGLFMVVIPLVFSTMALGVVNLGQVGSVGKVLGKTFGLFLFGPAIAAAIGLTLVNTVRPGDGLPKELVNQVMTEYQGEAEARRARLQGFGVQTFVNIVPRNPVEAAATSDYLAVIFFAVIFGLGLSKISERQAKPVVDVLEGIAEITVRIIGMVMQLAPLGVAMLVFSTASRFGLSLLKALVIYVVVVMCGLLFHMLVALGIMVRTLGGMNPVRFFKAIWPVILTAFSTSSSSATLPTSMRVAESGLGLPRSISGFVLPLGATANMHGTALFEGVTVLFLAQVFGVDLSFATQITVIVLAVITAVGTAGVPGGSLPLLAMVLETVGLPGQGIAIVLGVDRLLDMSRTTLNVVGDLASAVIIARSEGHATDLPEPS
ncbi:MAG: dicarboxylate/amino acid:cation symporter [Bryobacterales bacterium]|nr:dicarboxylate/amino acid:cation symporter [Bryobacterales bacterium]